MQDDIICGTACGKNINDMDEDNMNSSVIDKSGANQSRVGNNKPKINKPNSATIPYRDQNNTKSNGIPLIGATNYVARSLSAGGSKHEDSAAASRKIAVTKKVYTCYIVRCS